MSGQFADEAPRVPGAQRGYRAFSGLRVCTPLGRLKCFWGCFARRKPGGAHMSQERGQQMKNFANSVKNFLVSEDGPTAVEYAVMLALIVVVCLTAIQAIGNNANTKFGQVRDALT